MVSHQACLKRQDREHLPSRPGRFRRVSVANDQARHAPNSRLVQRDCFSSLDKVLRARLVRFFERRHRQSHEIEDMVHDVYVRLIRRPSLADVKHLEAFALSTARNVLQDRRRRASIREDYVAFVLQSGEPSAGIPSAEQILMVREQLSFVQLSLAELPKRTREIFLLRQLEGKSYKDIASRIQLSVSAVEKHVKRAKDHLRHFEFLT